MGLGSLGAVPVTHRDRDPEAAGERAEELTSADEHDARSDRVHPLGPKRLAERIVPDEIYYFLPTEVM